MHYRYLSCIVRLPCFMFVFGITIVCSHVPMHTLEGLFAVRLQVGRDYFGCEHVRTMLDYLFGGSRYVCLFVLLKIHKEPARVCVCRRG